MNNIPNIIEAKRCLWCEGEPSDIALETRPRINEWYWISVSNAINLSVGEASWLLYEADSVHYNDYSEASEFDQTCFCLVSVIARLQEGSNGTPYRVQVRELVSLREVMNRSAEEEFPTWKGFITRFFTQNDDALTRNTETTTLTHYGAYTLLSVSLQSDCGLDCVMMQHEERLYACLVAEWGFRNDEVLGGRFRLPE